MKHFIIGGAVGAVLMYLMIHYGTNWTSSGSQWIGGAASEYRGDARRNLADEALR